MGLSVPWVPHFLYFIGHKSTMKYFCFPAADNCNSFSAAEAMVGFEKLKSRFFPAANWEFCCLVLLIISI